MKELKKFIAENNLIVEVSGKNMREIWTQANESGIKASQKLVKEILTEMRKIRSKREYFSKTPKKVLTGTEKLRRFRRKHISSSVRNAFPFFTANKGNSEIRYGEKLHYYQTTTITGRTAQWTYSETNNILTLPESALNIPTKFVCLDGIVTVEVKKVSNKNGITLLDAVILTAKNREFSLKETKIAIKGNYSYHAENYSDAIEGLFNKINKTVKNYFRKNLVTLDTEMTRSLYAELTGACKIGIADFCEKNGLQNKTKIALRDLLPMLESQNAYGYKTLAEIVDKNTLALAV